VEPSAAVDDYRVQMNHRRQRVESVDAFDTAEGPENPVNQLTTKRSPWC
jgi:hypothetical protein